VAFVRFPPANLQLRRAQLVLALAALVPTILMTALGIVLLIVGEGSTTTLITGVLVLTFCTSIITGYILGSIFVNKGATLARVQNDFVSAVSHELRTPVTSIRLLLESLKDNRLADDDRRQVLDLLARETERLDLLVGRVLELSRLESGAHAYAREPVEVKELIEEAIAVFDAHTLAAPTKVDTHIDPGLVITGDRATLCRALANLLVNSWKYTGEDKRIVVEASGQGRWVDIVVRDNGAGIPKDEQKSIYEQFSRGRAAIDSGKPGVGLGLAFVRTTVKGNRGKLDLSSRPGDTTFRIRLRRRREPGEATAQVPQRAHT
jgi:two-component system phosphate regulon sensor histidine kinase PhoR